jgi:hypothetical protein
VRRALLHWPLTPPPAMPMTLQPVLPPVPPVMLQQPHTLPTMLVMLPTTL